MAEVVGDLPLAVDQTAGLLADTGMNTDDYVQLVAARTTDVLNRGGGGGYPVSLTASWAVAFDRLATDKPAALQLLTVVAWLGPEPVPLSLVTRAPGPITRRAGRRGPGPAGVRRGDRGTAAAGNGPNDTGQHPGTPSAGGTAARPHPRRQGR